MASTAPASSIIWLTWDVALSWLRHRCLVQFVCGVRRDGTNACLRHLGKIQRLSISKTQITDAGLTHLGALTNLAELNLCGTKVTDAGMAHLVRLRKLRKLVVFDAAVSDKGIAMLQQRLPQVEVYADKHIDSHPKHQWNQVHSTVDGLNPISSPNRA